MTVKEVAKKFKDANVLFVTNGIYSTNSLGGYTMKCWSPLFNDNFLAVPSHWNSDDTFDSGLHFCIYDSNNPALQHRYGLECFIWMLANVLEDNAILHKVDYIAYFDEDAFLISGHNLDESASALWEEFVRFRNSGCVISGIPDGRCSIFRTHNPYAPNPFFSFWDVKMMEQHAITPEEIKSLYKSGELKEFTWSRLSNEHGDLASKIEANSATAIEYANANSSEHTFDMDSLLALQDSIIFFNEGVKRHSEHFSWVDTATVFEPYYPLMFWLNVRCNAPTHFFKSKTVFCDIGDGHTTPAGTALCLDDKASCYDGSTWLVHSWYSRMFYIQADTQPEGQRLCRDRIHAILKYAGLED